MIDLLNHPVTAKISELWTVYVEKLTGIFEFFQNFSYTGYFSLHLNFDTGKVRAF